MKGLKRIGWIRILTALVLSLSLPVWADEPAAPAADDPVMTMESTESAPPAPPATEAAPPAVEGPSETKVALDTIWVLLAGMLVFFMNLGFAMVESGFCRSKNTVNILSKNFIVFAISSLAFWAIGWGLMFGDGNGFMGTQGLFFLGGEDNSPMPGELYKGVYSSISWATVPLLAKFFFQLVFAGTAATIVSGVVAERIKYISFIVFSFVLVAFVYPIVGHWIWGEDGWRSSGCGISPVPPSSTRSAAGQP